MSLFYKMGKGLAELIGGSKPKQENVPQANAHPGGFALWVGISTGELARRGHPAGVWANQRVWLKEDELCQNVIAIGGTGSGKTTRVINPLLWQLVRYPWVGGLIFDIKGDFGNAVYTYAAQCNKHVTTIGVGRRGINLLRGLSPEMAASFLQSTFYLTGGSGGDSFWIQSATDVCRNTLGMLSFLGDKYYTLEYLYQYIFYEKTRKMLNEQIDEIEISLEDGSRDKRLLNAYRGYYENVFEVMDGKVKQSIKGTLSNVLSPFQNPDLIDSFSGGEDDYDLTEILKGDIVLVDLPLSVWGIGGKVVYTFIKLRFFNLLQSRQSDKSLPQNQCFYMCDEYQEIISASKQGLSDLSFWDKSRSSKCVGIVSTQSVNAFRAAIGDQVLADTILTNFRQKIFFRTEDTATLQYMNNIAGKVEVERQSVSYGAGANVQHTPLIDLTSESENFGVSTNIVERQLIDPNLIRQLGQNNAIALLNIEGRAADDILVMQPFFL